MSHRPLILLLCAWMLCAAPPGSAAPRKEVRLCADVWCPYNCDPGAAQPGFAVEIAQAVFGASGYDVTYQAAGWARCIEDARAGLFSGIIAAIPEDAPDFTFPLMPIGSSLAAYAVRANDPFRYTGAHAFDGRVLAMVRSYSFGGETGAYIKAHADDSKRIEYVAGDDALQKNLDKLLAGRVDVVLDDENVLRSKIAALGLESRVRLVTGGHFSPLFIAFSPALPEAKDLARLLDAGIRKLRADGRLAAILARYHVQDGS